VIAAEWVRAAGYSDSAAVGDVEIEALKADAAGMLRPPLVGYSHSLEAADKSEAGLGKPDVHSTRQRRSDASSDAAVDAVGEIHTHWPWGVAVIQGSQTKVVSAVAGMDFLAMAVAVARRDADEVQSCRQVDSLVQADRTFGRSAPWLPHL
jgi:hypothetical protein